MKIKIKQILKKHIKFIIGLVIGIAITGTVYAAEELFPSEQVSYDNTTSGLTKTNVQDAIDELKTKADSCSSGSSGGSNSGAGWWCSGVSGNPLSGKKVIALGERDGVPAPAIQSVAETAGAEVVYSATRVYADTAGGGMDISIQQAVLDAVEQYGVENIVVLIGSKIDADAEITAATVTLEDPTYSGPLTNVSLGLLVYHVFDPDVKNYFDPDVYDEEIGMLEMVLDVDTLIDTVAEVRNDYCSSL